MLEPVDARGREEADAAVVDREDGCLGADHLVQRAQHGAVAAEHDDDVGVVRLAGRPGRAGQVDRVLARLDLGHHELDVVRGRDRARAGAGRRRRSRRARG